MFSIGSITCAKSWYPLNDPLNGYRLPSRAIVLICEGAEPLSTIAEGGARTFFNLRESHLGAAGIAERLSYAPFRAYGTAHTRTRESNSRCKLSGAAGWTSPQPALCTTC